MKIISKPWGSEEIIEQNGKYVVKRLCMNKGQKCSLQYHKFKTETIYVLKGTMELFYDNNITILNENEYITIAPYIHHRMSAPNENTIYLESSTVELDDIVRIEDCYGRS